MDSRERRYLNLFVAVISVLLSVFVWLITDYQVKAYNQQEQQKVDVLSKQIASRLEVFFKSRDLALDQIATNWPENHPNHQLWFSSQSLNVHGVLPGIQSILYVPNSADFLWQSPVNSIKNQDVGRITKLHLNASDKPSAHAKQLSNDEFAIFLTRPLEQNSAVIGHLYAVINVDVTVYFLMSEHLQGSYNLQIIDSGQRIFNHGELTSRQVQHREQIRVVDHQVDLVLSSNQNYRSHQAMLAMGLTLVFLISWLCRAALKNRFRASNLEKQYKAASNASLDGLLIFRSEQQKFVLSGINRVGERYTGLFKAPGEDFVFTDLLSSLGLQRDAEIRRAPHAVLKGESFEKQVKVSTINRNIEYLKLQMVRMSAGFAVTLRDVTSRVHAEQELKSREEKYSRLVNGLNGHFLYSINSAGKLDYVSSSVVQILGYKPTDFVENCHKYMVKNRLLDKRREYLQELLAGVGQGRAYLLEMIDNQGKRRILEFVDTIVRDEDGELLAIEGIAKDITSERELQERIEFQANHDALTGLHNRYAFDIQLEKLVSKVTKEEIDAALCYIDLDRFKIVNDSRGHVAGDQLLKQLGALIQNLLPKQHFIARLGGDEFGILFVDSDLEQANILAKQLLNEINVFRFVWQDEIFQIGASVGLAKIQSGLTAIEVMTAADTACYVAKDLGRNRVQIYQENDEELNYHKSRVGWVQKIKQALADNRFELFMQTIKPLCESSGKGHHYEVLLRMRDENSEMVSPALFIPVAERFDLMRQIDQWVFDEVIATFVRRPELYSATDKCSINLSGNTITDEEFANYIIDELTRNNVNPEVICFEITETAAVTKLNSANIFIEKLREFGCKFALDDFGAGMCSFAYLKHLPVDYVKIDGGFVKNMCSEQSDEAIVKSINDIAHSLGKETIAEFVADEETEQRLLSLGINYVQGFFIDKPHSFNAQPSVQRLAS